MKISIRSAIPSKAELIAVVLTSASAKEFLNASRKSKRKADLVFSALAELEEHSAGALSLACKRDKFSAAPGSQVSVSAVKSGALIETLLLGAPKVVGDQSSREQQAENLSAWRKLGAVIIDQARKVRASRVAVVVPNLKDEFLAICALNEGLSLAGYRFTRYKSKSAALEAQSWMPSEVSLVGIPANAKHQSALEEGQAFAQGTLLARDLVNTPARDCTPGYLVRIAKEQSKRYGYKAEVYDRRKLERLGADVLLSVSDGSDQPPYLIKLIYKPSRRPRKVISLVGKGVTFDSGGYSIKTASGMESMKVDMSGAAAVLGALQILSVLDCPYEVRGYIPAVENMINGAATKPGDVVRGVLGKSVEILNTDAEGRLILSDTLTLAERDGCDQIVDVATLTGACVVALGNDYAGLFCSDNKLSQQLQAAAAVEGERIWPLPLAPEYRDLIKSQVADIKNTGGPVGGAITGALFLQEFIEKTPWAHIDIAGPATSDSDKGAVRRGGTGFAARTLARYVLDR